MVVKRLLLVAFLVTVINYDQGAFEQPGDISEKLLPVNLRLTNANSSMPEFESCDKIVASFLNNWKIVGASVAIARNGRLIYAKGHGYSDTTHKTVTEPYNKFRIASISKLVTAVAIMKLGEEGRLSLGDKVFGSEGILDDPFFDDPKDRRVHDITVAHLLSHEGGWTQKYGDQMFMPLVVAGQMGVDLPVDNKTIIRFALDKRLHFTPGSGRSYSNLGYAILGLVIEKVTGMSYEKYCRESILEPLGIFDMQIAGNLPTQKAPFEVTYYQPVNQPFKPSIYGTGEMLPPCYGGNDVEGLGAAGSWIATAPDLMRLLLAVDGFDTYPDILTEESIQFMTDMNKGHAPVGWKSTMPDGTWNRTGSFPGTAAMLKRQPDGIAWVVLLNTSSWNGPVIHSYVNSMMTKIVARINEWPDYDLFRYSMPLPLRVRLSSAYVE